MFHATTAPVDATPLWLPYRRPRPDAALRLFCFPYAGGLASAFRAWQNDAPEAVDVCAVQLPGRETHWTQPPFTSLPRLLDALEEVLEPLMDRPYALAGHSMGGTIAYELARRLQSRRPPVHLFVSGTRAPHLPDPRGPRHALPHDALVQELREIGGTPPEVLEHRELMEMVLPLVRADLELNDTHVHVPGPPLEVPLTAFGGVHDPIVPAEAVEGWRAYTSGGFRLRMFEGDHFFIHSHHADLLGAVLSDLNGHCRGAGRPADLLEARIR
ncbi:MAG TPA: alpha/beta fold hydrolase [Longimicrobium sp.]|nr:alpha/beta fold hydrolase [Longimicrobium sp.]